MTILKRNKYTHENITELKENEIFVFGSNLNGNHAGGAALYAVKKFGAIMGHAVGLQGQSYAIPTLGKDMEKLDISEIEKYVFDLYIFAKENQHLTFYVTLIGCGIAGFKTHEILPVFRNRRASNVILPIEFSI